MLQWEYAKRDEIWDHFGDLLRCIFQLFYLGVGMEAKKWFESKVILVNVLMGIAMILAQFYPPAAEFIKTYFAEAGMGWAFINVILRAIKSNIVF